jgi:hypothetical protein
MNLHYPYQADWFIGGNLKPYKRNVKKDKTKRTAGYLLAVMGQKKVSDQVAWKLSL